VDFTSYKDAAVGLAVDLVNSLGSVSGIERLTDPDAARALLERYGVSRRGSITKDDVAALRDVRSRLREVFVAADQHAAIGALNALLADSGATPYLTNHDGEPWHLHYAPPGSRLPQWLGAHAAMGLAGVIADEGFGRLKVCEGQRCEDVFVDTSKNRSRRFCSADLCGNRASVAAYRERQRGRAAR
jgi:predicted RNA-binding Zn ribbon-like protein